ncbi:efflux RND transporter periplasmic adaptor subunit [Ferrimonas lipolytica]|uniref:Efflux RND transporter periplasmic adaptor subunit n=1 Tax=Ferrimonas lipolytica TaxID=2724191 RepID=A0A6H1UBA8_9GAMM|nr:efflux RND transporter periplasmic adaptor subunit [Ferrimonas lipolytica]QIZ76341.1 efflux RND transporter periplasmic adaptor subunit [Ferrimonas lipolytica]
MNNNNLRAVTAIVAALTLSGCGRAPDETALPIAAVNVVTVAQSQQKTERYFTGQVVVAELTNLSFRIEGKLEQLDLVQGQKVRKGQLLAQLDDTSARQNWYDANAQHQLLQRNYSRSEQLLKKGLLAQSEFDELSANLRLASVNLGIAAAQLSYTELRAPFAGVIDQINKENYETAAAGESVISIYRDDRTDVELQISDTLLMGTGGLTRNEDYQPMVESDSHPEPLAMNYLEHSLQIDSSTGAFHARISTDKPTKLLPGEAVRIRINLADAGLPVINGYLVPLSAVQPQSDNHGFQVWRVEDGVVAPVPVTVENIGQQGALISGPITPGEQLVTTRLSQLRPQQQVEVVSQEHSAQ